MKVNRFSSAAEVSLVGTFPEKSSTEDECAKTVLIVHGRAQPNTSEQVLWLYSCLRHSYHRLECLPRAQLSPATRSLVQLSIAREHIPRNSVLIFHMVHKTNGKRVHLASSKSQYLGKGWEELLIGCGAYIILGNGNWLSLPLPMGSKKSYSSGGGENECLLAK